MRNFSRLTAIAGLLVLQSGVASADPKPPGAKYANPQIVANSVAGSTHLWKSCNGGIYYGGNWQAQAWCNKDGPSVGIGTWSVDRKGRLCYKLTWYWPKGDGLGSKSKPVTDKECDDHLVSKDGTLWRSWGGEPDWWKFHSNPNRVKGFKYKSKINRLRKKLGV
jgi:hypothetical protein